MKEEEFIKLQGFYNSLLGCERILKESSQFIPESTFRPIANELYLVQGKFPESSAFVESAFHVKVPYRKEYRDGYDAVGLRLYLTMILGRLEAHLSSITTVSIPSMKMTREGIFFAGQVYDAFQRVADILVQAQQTIVIIDGYIGDGGKVLKLLTGKQSEVEVRILTKEVVPALQAAAEAFNQQYGNLTIRTSKAFHDRFIIVDDKDFYHLGASIKDAGKQGFMFSLIEEPEVIEALRTKFDQEWANTAIAP